MCMCISVTRGSVSIIIQWNRSTNGTKECPLISEVSSLMHERVILGAGKGVLFREVSAQFRGVMQLLCVVTLCVCMCVCVCVCVVQVIAVEKSDAEASLAEALPALEEARLALDDLDKNDVTEIR